MANKMTVTETGDGVAIEVTYDLKHSGTVTIEVQSYLSNPSLIELQAVACEQAAAGLATIAANFRSRLPKSQEPSQEAAGS